MKPKRSKNTSWNDGTANPKMPTQAKIASRVALLSTTYTGADLAPFTARAGAAFALSLPSRTGDTLHFRDGSTQHSPIAPKVPAFKYPSIY